MIRPGALAAIGIALLVPTGCGDLEVAWKGDRLVREAPLTVAEISAWPAGGPERALLSWYRAMQRGDGPAAARSYVPAVRVRGGELALEQLAAAPYFRAAAPPRVLDVVRRGDEATVFTRARISYAQPNGRRDDVIGLLQAFTLERRAGRWLLPNTLFLRYAARTRLRTDPKQPRQPAPRTVTRADLEVQPAGGPARAALELLRTFQFNDPTGAGAYLTAAWDPRPARIARILARFRSIALGFGSPPFRVTTSGPRTATLRARLAGQRATMRMVRRAGQWKAAGLRTSGGLDVP